MSVKNVIENVLACFAFIRANKLVWSKSTIFLEYTSLSVLIDGNKIEFTALSEDTTLDFAFTVSMYDLMQRKEIVEQLITQSLIAVGYQDPDSSIIPCYKELDHFGGRLLKFEL